MQFSPFIFMLFAGTALSATTSTRTTVRPPAATVNGAPKIAAPRALKPAAPPTATDVKNSNVNWVTSFNAVNAYLDDPMNKTKLAAAVVYAKDEPVQLATLMKVTALPASGVNAGKVLMGNFPSVVSNLQSVQSGSMSTQDATAALNFNRCCTFLPAIGMLWVSAANQTNAVTVAMPNLESQCSQMNCASGVSAGAVNGTALAVVFRK